MSHAGDYLEVREDGGSTLHLPLVSLVEGIPELTDQTSFYLLILGYKSTRDRVTDNYAYPLTHTCM